MYKKTILLSSFLFILTFSLGIISSAQAQDSIINPNSTPYADGDYTLNDILTIAVDASKWILGIVGSLTLIMFIYGGFTFLISAGSSDKIGEAKKIITAAVVGLIIVFSSYLIISFVIGSLGLKWSGEAVTPAKTTTVASTTAAKAAAAVKAAATTPPKTTASTTTTTTTTKKAKAQCEIDYRADFVCKETSKTGSKGCVEGYCPKFTSKTILCCPK